MTPTLATTQLVIDADAAPVPFLMTDVHMTLTDLAAKAAKHKKVARICDTATAIFTVWITSTVPLRQSEVMDMLWGTCEAAPIGLIPAIFTNPANNCKLHVIECVWGGTSAAQSR